VLIVLSVAKGEDEEAWTAAAMNLTEKRLKAAVRATGIGGAGGDDADDLLEVDTTVLRMTGLQRDRLDHALFVARELEGYDKADWKLLECIAQETLGTLAGRVPDEGGKKRARGSGEKVLKELMKTLRGRRGEIRRQLRVIEEAQAATAKMPEETGWVAPTPKMLDHRLRRLLQRRKRFDVPLGELLAWFFDNGLWAVLGYECKEDYCRDRLGICARSANERVWLERKMRALPALRAALASGVLTYTKALVVAREATPADVEERIAEAASTTWQQIEKKSREKEEERDRKRGIRRLWGPKHAAEVVNEAISAVQEYFEEQGETIDRVEALARMADHFVEIWEPALKLRKIPKDRREVLMRAGGLCAWPGCSRAAVHDHHVEYGWAGRPDETWNRIGIMRFAPPSGIPRRVPHRSGPGGGADALPRDGGGGRVRGVDGLRRGRRAPGRVTDDEPRRRGTVRTHVQRGLESPHDHRIRLPGRADPGPDRRADRPRRRHSPLRPREGDHEHVSPARQRRNEPRRPQDHQLRAEGTSLRIQDLRPLPARPEGDDLRLRAAHAGAARVPAVRRVRPPDRRSGLLRDHGRRARNHAGRP
jgi:hypothetical protein